MNQEKPKVYTAEFRESSVKLATVSRVNYLVRFVLPQLEIILLWSYIPRHKIFSFSVYG